MSTLSTPTTSSVSPVITEKATHGSEQTRSCSGCAATPTKPEIKAAVEQLFKRQGASRSTRSSARARPSGSAAVKGKRSDVKKAIVTLAEGDKIDMTTRI